ncbi:MAG: hypothetical protein ACK559_20455, partial [bacterium]
GEAHADEDHREAVVDDDLQHVGVEVDEAQAAVAQPEGDEAREQHRRHREALERAAAANEGLYAQQDDQQRQDFHDAGAGPVAHGLHRGWAPREGPARVLRVLHPHPLGAQAELPGAGAALDQAHRALHPDVGEALAGAVDQDVEGVGVGLQHPAGLLRVHP